MANYTATYSENAGTPGSGSSTKSWTLRINYGNITIPTNSSTFIFQTPDIYAKYSASDTKRPYCRARVSGEIKIGNRNLGELSALLVNGETNGSFQWRNFDLADITPWKKINNNTEFKLTKYNYTPQDDDANSYLHKGILNTNHFFNSNNSTSKTLPIVLTKDYDDHDDQYGRIFFASKKNSTVGDNTNRCYYQNNNFTDIPIGNLVLDAPPIVNSTTVTQRNPENYPTSYYSTNLSTFEVEFDLTAQYGGTITRTDLIIGSQHNTFTTPSQYTGYTGTLRIVPNQTGTFIPDLVVTDSRGQVSHKSLGSITVNYQKPTVSISNLQRVTISNGTVTPDDENGTSATFAAKFTCQSGVQLTTPLVTITPSINASTITWYSDKNFNNQVTFPTSAATLYAKVATAQNFPLDTAKSYTFKVTPRDTNYELGTNGTPISTTLPMAYYTVDFKAGGYGIAFGQPATTNGFVCAMPTTFTGNSTVTFAGDANFTNTLKYKGSHVATNVNFDSTNKKLTKTVNNTVTDIVTALNFVANGSGFQFFTWDNQTFYTDANNAQKTGWSIITHARITSDSASVQHMPSGNTSGGYWECYNMNDNFCNQFFYPRETTDTSFYWRKKASGNWGSWLEVQSGKKVNAYGEEASNLNNCTATGFYTYDAAASNKPFANAGGSLFVFRSGTNNIYQVAFANTSAAFSAANMRIYARRYYGGSWDSNWYKFTLTS